MGSRKCVRAIIGLKLGPFGYSEFLAGVDDRTLQIVYTTNLSIIPAVTLGPTTSVPKSHKINQNPNHIPCPIPH
jgi:hypothetical protein